MAEQHPITPPPELVQQWYEDGPEDDERGLVEVEQRIVEMAIEWAWRQRG